MEVEGGRERRGRRRWTRPGLGRVGGSAWVGSRDREEKEEDDWVDGSRSGAGGGGEVGAAGGGGEVGCRAGWIGRGAVAAVEMGTRE